MKAKAVSVLRDKRGLPACVGPAEPQVVGPTPQTTRKWKTDTMKEYILKPFPPVEPQAPHAPCCPNSITPTSLAYDSSRGSSGRSLFIGLDVHNDSIALSLASSDSTEVRRYGIIGGTHDDVVKLVKKLQGAHPKCCLQFCYEAGPRG